MVNLLLDGRQLGRFVLSDLDRAFAAGQVTVTGRL